MRKIILAIVILALKAGAYEYISGEMSGTYPAKDYFVTGTIYVQRNQTLTFEAGSRLFFEQFSGITVLGALVLDGTIDNPILLTSKKERPDRLPNEVPESFDWNGIEGHEDAKLLGLRNVKLYHSVFGLNIKSEATKISLENVEFFNNGYASLVRDGKMVSVQPGVPFGTMWNMDSENEIERVMIRKSEETNKTAKKDNQSGAETKKKKTKKADQEPDEKSDETVNAKQTENPQESEQKASRKTQKDESTPEEPKMRRIKLSVNIGSAALAATGITLLTANTIQKGKNLESYNRQQDPQGAEHFRKKYERNGLWQGIGGALVGVALAGVGVTFLF
ncbi:MAG: hypothetical protein ACLFQB_13990 [Chitinispirillaceae bacterium]